ncbi:MAG TPA: hypothetical protein VEU73_13225 [Gemmatimonadales bacterium]|nr:hypothetical protein [Gemmatimonadales bacterium]
MIRKTTKTEYRITARKPPINYAYTRTIRIRPNDAGRPRAFNQAKRIAERAARRGYTVNVTFVSYEDARMVELPSLELRPLDLPPWGK